MNTKSRLAKVCLEVGISFSLQLCNMKKVKRIKVIREEDQGYKQGQVMVKVGSLRGRDFLPFPSPPAGRGITAAEHI